ncbi:GerAB/ArcD/ProY family transporter [Caproiciproducens sp. R2]|uniref:GerAB/ArcD/ProY family transporter n=1 Tax=Caproiciproducens sp. R2 TaxID=3435187 RepID=UPI00403452C3
MTNYKITGKQMTSLFSLFWFGTLVLFGADKDVKQDFWVSILLAAVFMIPMAALYIRLTRLYPEKDLYEMLFSIFGRFFGTVMSLISVFFSLFIGYRVLGSFSLYIKTTALDSTPRNVTSIFFIIMTIAAVTCGAETIARTSNFLIKFVIGFVCVSTLICLGNMNLENLKPVMNSDLKVILNSSYKIFIIPWSEAFICLSFFSKIDRKESTKKILVNSMLLIILTHLVIGLRNVLVLGPSASIYYFSSDMAISTASLGDFFERFEILVGVNLVLAGTIKLCVCIYSASLGLYHILGNTERKFLVVPCTLIILTTSLSDLQKLSDVFDRIPSLVISMTPFEVIFPVIIWISAEIRNRKKTKPAADLPGDLPGIVQ